MHPDGPTLSHDLESAAWIAPQLNGVWGSVGNVVPTGYEAYARVLHPVDDADERIPWGRVAEETGRTVHPLVQWHRLVGSNDPYNSSDADWAGGPPRRGELEPIALAALLRILIPHTTTPDNCRFCVWEGYGLINPSPGSRSMNVAWLAADVPPAPIPEAVSVPADVVAGARVSSLPREYLLFHGRAASAAFIGEQVTPDWFLPQSPNLFWPDDHAWCVGSEIDLDSTLVAGSNALIDELLSSADLEVWRVSPDTLLTYDADQIN